MGHQIEAVAEVVALPLPRRAAPAAALCVQLAGEGAGHPAVLHAYGSIVRAMAWVHGAHEVRGQAQTLTICFWSACDAVECAMGVQRAFAAYARRRPRPRVSPRIGVHAAGEHDVQTDTPEMAAGLAELTAPGEILASAQVRALAGDGSKFGDAEVALLPDTDESLVVHDVAWEPHEGDAVDPALIDGFDAGRDALAPRLLRAVLRREGTA